MIKFILFIFGLIFLTCTNPNGGGKNQKLEENPHLTKIKRETSQVICEAFLFGPEKVNLYDKIDGKVINTVQNSYEEEILYSIEIYDQDGDWFNISAAAMGDTLSGWMKNKSYLATYSRNYTDTLFVYLKPNKNEIKCSIPDYFTSPMKIIECNKNWVKVEIKDDHFGLACDGWVLQKMTCASPYTTCP